METATGRIELQERIDRSRSGESEQPFPYHTRDSTMIYLICAFDPAGVRSLLPSGLDPSAAYCGPISLVTTRASPHHRSFTQLYVGLELDGHESPDGTPGIYECGGQTSGKLGEAYRSIYNANMQVGDLQFKADGEGIEGSAVQSGRSFLRVGARPMANPVRQAGFTNYFGAHPEGGIGRTTVMCEYSLAEAELTRFEISSEAPAWLRNLKPRVLLPYVVHDLAITISEVRRYDELPEETVATHLRLRLLKTFSHLGRAAIIVDAAGFVRYSNPAADALLAAHTLRPGTRLRAARATDQEALEAAITAVTGRASAQPPDSLVFSRAGGLAPLIVRILPVDELLAGAGHALLLLSDPSRPPAAPQAAASLELLGLTPAEARLAAIVGQGSAPRSAAKNLGIAESTARTVLRTIYDKLSIRRQSQLANLVSRLDGA